MVRRISNTSMKLSALAKDGFTVLYGQPMRELSSCRSYLKE